MAPSAETIALLERLRARDRADLSPQRPAGSPAQLDEPLAASRELPVPVTSFVGRQQELAQLRAILPSGRLLTLTGPVGGGKTRLALALARGQMSAGAYAHGVCWVDLALAPVLPRGAHGADSLARLILRNLGEAYAPDRVALAALADTLGRSAMLLVLDGCAHLVGPASADRCGSSAVMPKTCHPRDESGAARSPRGAYLARPAPATAACAKRAAGSRVHPRDGDRRRPGRSRDCSRRIRLRAPVCRAGSERLARDSA